MSLERLLDGLAKNVTPSDTLKQTIKARMEARIKPQHLLSAISNVQPNKALTLSVKERILRSIYPQEAETLESFASGVEVPPSTLRTLKDVIMGRLEPVPVPVINTGFKWAATFALILLAVRSMPLLFLAPATHAEVGIQLVPNGEEVSIYVGGVWREATEPQVITSAVMVKTGASSATLIMNDDGVFRLGPNTTLKLHDTGDRPQYHAEGPVATLIRGEVWALGLLPPIVEGLNIETTYGTISLNTGSVSIDDENNGSITVSVYDRGTTLTNGQQTSFLVAGEKATLKEGKTFGIQTMPSRVFDDERVKNNLSQDAVHRGEIAKLLEARRAEVAGILPNSFLYPAKRIAEEVDVLFTLTHDGRTEKRIGQANTRLNEALALIEEGEGTEAAAGPISEYRDSLVALASGEDDNLVKYLIKKQIADASISLSAPNEDPNASVQLLKDAVAQIGAAIPDTDLKPRDIEGYVLVDRLAQINQMLSGTGSALAAAEYAEISPYLSGLLTGTGGAHPLLQKEAQSLLVSTSSLLKNVVKSNSGQVFIAMESDVAKYLPDEPEQVLVSEEELGRQVEDMRKRIFIFNQPISRYNQLLAEMRELENNPNRGTLLRRLKAALPERLGEYVNTEIQKLGDELKDR